MYDRERVIKKAERIMRSTVDRYMIDSFCEDVIALLEEQEAVKPEKKHSGSGITWWNVCGNCKTAINPNDKYCHECGTPVLWEGR